MADRVAENTGEIQSEAVITDRIKDLNARAGVPDLPNTPTKGYQAHRDDEYGPKYEESRANINALSERALEGKDEPVQQGEVSNTLGALRGNLGGFLQTKEGPKTTILGRPGVNPLQSAAAQSSADNTNK